jgi:hypothetical protein
MVEMSEFFAKNGAPVTTYDLRTINPGRLPQQVRAVGEKAAGVGLGGD